MAAGFCCVAGLTEHDHRHVRPVTGGRLSTSLLAPEGGPFDMGAIVDLGEASPWGKPPEVEDHFFVPAEAERLGFVSADRLWEILASTAGTEFEALFGETLERRGHRATVAAGEGAASLATYRPAIAPLLTVEDRGDRPPSLRIRLDDEGFDLSLTDARYYRDGYSRPDLERVAAAQSALLAGAAVMLGVGLTRPFAPTAGEEPRHWLQVNALHLRPLTGLRLR